MAKPPPFETMSFPRTLVIGIDAPYNKTPYIQSYFDEFLSLVETSGVPYEASHFVKIRTVDPAYFFTRGKLQDIKDLCDQHEIEQIIISEPISPRQERNLSEFIDCDVFDRTALILDIFEKAAHSAEGKAQVAIARLTYRKARLAGKGIHMSQQTGALGARGGPGETAKEIENRHIDEEILKIKRQLKKVEQSRSTQRQQRLARSVSHICLIGYTNVGKSTILNMLTKSNVLAENKLFATLDTTTRELYIDHNKIGVISDTVGFIQQLPHQLIEAFKSTLSELQYAHLLLHVVDVSDLNWQSHIGIVLDILRDLNVSKEMVYVFNKVDRIENPEELEKLMTQIEQYHPHIVISARSKEGIQPLREFLATWKPTTPSPETEVTT